MKTNKKETRGGARKGAGRKAKSPEDKAKWSTIAVRSETADKIRKQAAARNLSPGDLLDEWASR